MNDLVRAMLYRQANKIEQIARAKSLSMTDIRATVELPLEPDDFLSPMTFSARLLRLNERSSYVWMSWASEYAGDVNDVEARQALTTHARRVRLLSSKLDPQKTHEIWVSEALEFARKQDWLDAAVPVVLDTPAMPSTRSCMPDPLSSSEMAYCFADLYSRTEQQWKNALGKAKSSRWLSACVHTHGIQGRGHPDTMWNPVALGAALVSNGHAKPNSIRARFKTKPALQPWLELWKDREVEWFTTE